LNQKQRWWAYHLANPGVFKLFERFSFEAIEAGQERLSHWLITNRIRWEHDVVERKTEAFKISNDFIAYYARLFMWKHMEHQGIFDIRQLQDEEDHIYERLSGKNGRGHCRKDGRGTDATEGRDGEARQDSAVSIPRHGDTELPGQERIGNQA